VVETDKTAPENLSDMTDTQILGGDDDKIDSFRAKTPKSRKSLTAENYHTVSSPPKDSYNPKA
jgi:hypothetical protein